MIFFLAIYLLIFSVKAALHAMPDPLASILTIGTRSASR